MHERQIKLIKDLLIFSFLVLLITVIGIFVPFVALIWPLPVVVFILRWGGRLGVAMVLLISLFTLFLFGAQAFIAVILVTGFIGVVVGSAFLEGYDGYRVFLITIIVAVLAQTLFFGSSQVFMADDFFLVAQEYVEETAALYGQAMDEDIAEQVMMLMGLLFPVYIFISGAIMGLVNYYLLYYLGSRYRWKLPPIFPVEDWRVHRFWAWAFFFSVLAYVGSGIIVFLNIVLIIALFFLGGGLSFAYRRLKTKITGFRMNGIFLALLVLIIFPALGILFMSLLSLFVAPVLTVIGFVDSFKRLQ